MNNYNTMHYVHTRPSACTIEGDQVRILRWKRAAINKQGTKRLRLTF